jgi:hypothetical protein
VAGGGVTELEMRRLDTETTGLPVAPWPSCSSTSANPRRDHQTCFDAAPGHDRRVLLADPEGPNRRVYRPIGFGVFADLVFGVLAGNGRQRTRRPDGRRG